MKYENGDANAEWASVAGRVAPFLVNGRQDGKDQEHGTQHLDKEGVLCSDQGTVVGISSIYRVNLRVITQRV